MADIKNPYYTGLEDFWHSPAAVTQAGAGVASMGADIYGMSQQNLGLNNASYSQAATAKPQGINGGEVFGGAVKGAAVGTSILPGVGTAIGAGVGAIANIAGGVIRKNKQEDERDKALKAAALGQQQDNQRESSNRNQNLQQQSYYNSMNPYNREYNVYSTRF
jgi:Sec-independent protein translocase protein TatA